MLTRSGPIKEVNLPEVANKPKPLPWLFLFKIDVITTRLADCIGPMNNPLIAFEDKSMNPLPLKGDLQMSNMIDVNKSLIDKFFVGKEIRVYWSQAGHQLNDDEDFVTSICIRT